MLFTVRTNKVGTHKGQVAFPGGHIDDGETAEEAAVRELREEVGPHLDVQVLGQTPPVLAITGTIVTPVVGFIENVKTEEDLQLLRCSASEDEVESIFTLRLSQLTNDAHRGVEDIHRGPMMPYFTAGPAKIWGLTVRRSCALTRAPVALRVFCMFWPVALRVFCMFCTHMPNVHPIQE